MIEEDRSPDKIAGSLSLWSRKMYRETDVCHLISTIHLLLAPLNNVNALVHVLLVLSF